MKRDEFIRKIGLAGAGLYLMPSLLTASGKEEIAKNFDVKL